MPAAPKPKPKAALSPEQEAVRRAQAAYDTDATDYQGDLLASGTIRDAIARAVADSDPTLGQLRTSKADVQKRLGSVYADSMDELSGITDPRIREQIRSRRSAEFGAEAERLGGLVSDRRGSQDQTVDRFTGVFGAQLSGKQFGLEQKRAALDRAAQAQHTAEQRAFESRFDDLTRREKEASIAAANRSNRGDGSTFTLEDALKNPLGAFLMGGGKRVQDKDGGFAFFAPDGRPITVEEAAAMTPGGTKSDFLSGSKNPMDAEYSGGKEPSAERQKQAALGTTGLLSLGDIEKFVNSNSANSTLSYSKIPFGGFSKDAQQYKNAAYNVKDALSRLRTGAAMTKNEEKFYERFIPGASDTSESRRQKIENLRQIFTLARGNPTGAQQLIEGQLGGDTFVVDTGI
jgi:hypothetical protein